jgi:hypothetical protein
MPSQATITSRTGPGSVVTGTVLRNLTKFSLDLGKKVLSTEANGEFGEFDIAATTTLTVSIAAGQATIVLSQ